MKSVPIDPNIRRDVGRQIKRERVVGESGGLALVAGLVLGPIAVLGNMQAAYSVAPVVCGRWPTVLIHVIHAVSLLLAVAGGLIAHRAWSTAGRGWSEDHDGPVERTRFLGIVGVGFTTLCVLVILAQWLATLIFRPCQ